MLYDYVTEVRYEPVMSNGALRKVNFKIRAKSYTGALMQAAKRCKEKDIEARKLHVYPGIPVCLEERKKTLIAVKERHFARHNFEYEVNLVD